MIILFKWFLDQWQTEIVTDAQVRIEIGCTILISEEISNKKNEQVYKTW